MPPCYVSRFCVDHTDMTCFLLAQVPPCYFSRFCVDHTDPHSRYRQGERDESDPWSGETQRSLFGWMVYGASKVASTNLALGTTAGLVTALVAGRLLRPLLVRKAREFASWWVRRQARIYLDIVREQTALARTADSARLLGNTDGAT